MCGFTPHLISLTPIHILTGPDMLKDTVFVHATATTARDGNYKHYMGQKGFPMFSSLDNYCYEKMNIPDVMHNLSRSVLILYFPQL